VFLLVAFRTLILNAWPVDWVFNVVVRTQLLKPKFSFPAPIFFLTVEPKNSKQKIMTQQYKNVNFIMIN
jgi:hypothetical protein